MDNLDSSNSGFNAVEDVNYPQLEVKQVNLVTSVGGKPTGMPILSDISFNVFSGSRIVIIGPSGAGKTSLFRLLNRLSEPTSGAIYLENQDYRTIGVIELRRQVMLVPQEPKLLGMTVKQALAYPLTLQQLPEFQIKKRLDTYMEKLHIPSDWLERTEVQLSVGQRQLVAIARALVTQPKILLLDEPTSALDAGIASHLVSVLTDEAVQSKMTILMINHQLDIAQQFCTRVLYLQNGQLLQNTSVTQVDWRQLRESLVQAEAQAAVEWL
jgi:D-methionine transport system ATP-binding protein